MIYANSNGLADVKKDVETVEEMGDSLWRLPNRSGLGRLWWAFTWPIKFVLTITIPNPKTFPRMYPFTFLMCIIWIGANAYLIVWMVTIIGMLKPFFSFRTNTHTREGDKSIFSLTNENPFV